MALNTHHYDGKLKSRIDSAEIQNESLRNRLKEINNIPFETKRYRFIDFKKEITAKAAKGLDYIIRGTGNYDPTNELKAENVLYLILERDLSDPEGIKPLLIEQLEDILNGSCSQGRTTRLYQILASMEQVS